MGSCSAVCPEVRSCGSAGSAREAVKRVGASISSTLTFGVGKSTWNSSIVVSYPHERNSPAMYSALLASQGEPTWCGRAARCSSQVRSSAGSRPASKRCSSCLWAWLDAASKPRSGFSDAPKAAAVARTRVQDRTGIRFDRIGASAPGPRGPRPRAVYSRPARSPSTATGRVPGRKVDIGGGSGAGSSGDGGTRSARRIGGAHAGPSPSLARLPVDVRLPRRHVRGGPRTPARDPARGSRSFSPAFLRRSSRRGRRRRSGLPRNTPDTSSWSSGSGG